MTDRGDNAHFSGGRSSGMMPAREMLLDRGEAPDMVVFCNDRQRSGAREGVR